MAKEGIHISMVTSTVETGSMGENMDTVLISLPKLK